jgi:hypothetical protein
VLLYAAFPVLTATKKLKKSFFSFLVFSTEMYPTKRKQHHKVTASSDEEDDAWMPGACVNVRPGAKKQSKRKLNVHEEKDCTAEMGTCDEAATVEITQADVHNLKHCSTEELAEMGKCAEATPVERTQADLCNPKHCFSEEPAEMGKCFELTSIADDLFKPNPNSPEESVAQVLASGSSNLPPQENKTAGNTVTWDKDF